ncbi:MAG: SAM-dependent methyltransferase [Rhodopirellula sp.]|nr:SAM-dependent methyltransferase [Rhodopirellula sp.]
MSFVFAVCQAGAEAALKNEVSRRHPELRLAFSRPGFVTLKTPDSRGFTEQFQLKSVFARSWGHSVGKVVGTDGNEMARQVGELLTAKFTAEQLATCGHLHVWERDRFMPGSRDFEPGVSVLAAEVGRILEASEFNAERQLIVNAIPEPNSMIIDCVLVEPGEWWIGWHIAEQGPSCWPGGVPQIELPEEAVSRTWLKMVEGLMWSGLPVKPGDAVAEIGSSPGGSCQALLGLGLTVTGIDPAEMDEALLKEEKFTHVRGRAKDLPRRLFSNFRWLASDASAVPNYSLDTIEAIVTHPSVKIEGLLLTLKFTDWKLADEIPLYHKRIRSWGYQNVRSRQLAFNRREICVAATKD